MVLALILEFSVNPVAQDPERMSQIIYWMHFLYNKNLKFNSENMLMASGKL